MNHRRNGRGLLPILIGALFFAFLVVDANAQADTSTITGVVQDAQGAGIAGATITLSNQAKGFTRTVQSNNEGAYSFINVPPGTYQLEVTHQGFKKYVQAEVKALVTTTIQVNVSLEVGSVTEEVTVTTNSVDSIINTSDATIGHNFEPAQIQQLPADSRNINGFLSLQPGVTADGYVNGGRSDQANITLDGVDVNDQQTGTAFFSVLRPLAEATEEWRVTTTNANAELGRSSGAQITLLTKSGHNKFEGSAFYLKRPTDFSANDFFNNLNGLPRAPLNRDVWGGSFGGPIIKDKLFFFYSYEHLQETKGISILQQVPLASLGQGIITISPGVTVTQAQFNSWYPGVNGQNPAALALLSSAAARYQSNSTEVGDGLNTGGYRFTAPTHYKENAHVLRLDWTINSHQQFFIRGQKQHDPSTGASRFPDTPAPENWSHSTGFALGHTWSIGNNKTNNFRYGYTRLATTSGGDATGNSIVFRNVFQPYNYSYGQSRISPIQNFTDDFTLIKGNHTIQFGGNVRIIRNNRVNNGASFSSASTNNAFYAQSGRVLLAPLASQGYNISTSDFNLQSAVAAVIGRFSQYSATYVYDLQGNVIPEGTPIERDFASEEYDVYGQDSWKINPHLTVNFGLRYGLSRPVYEKNGYQIRPNIALSDYFELRKYYAGLGVPYNQPINFEMAGPKNNGPGFYSLDKNNFQPRVSAAWSPNFKSGFWGKLFGKDNESVFRGGFAITNDYFGQQLAVSFNQLSTLGFVSKSAISANTYNITNNPPPLFTGLNQAIFSLPGVSPTADRFATPADESARIESSLDSALQSPVNYQWNFSYGRKLPHGLYIEASYVGRKARHLLVQRDAMQLNNLVDPKSGTDWYTAAGKIYDAFYSGTEWDHVATVPYFENLFPSLRGAINGTNTATQAVAWVNENYSWGDWTYLQQLLDDDYQLLEPGAQPGWSNYFFQPQYAAFDAFSTVGNSDYHGASLSIRQRLGNSATIDFNYTFSKSMDDASGLQTSGAYGSAFIINDLLQHDSYARSDFDARHVFNANFLVQLPVGKGRKFFNDSNKWVDAVIGGWQLGGIFRYNTGLPIWTPYDSGRWATNWEISSYYVRTKPIQSSIDRDSRNLFANLDTVLDALRPPKPGETGDRNVFFGPAWSQTDLNLGKTFKMPWGEGHKLQFRWEVFNVFNQQFFDEGSLADYGLTSPDAYAGEPATWASGSYEFTAIRGIPRRMQFVLRYSF